MGKPCIYFRADGNSQMGLGHVIRSCALAKLLRSEFECSFFIRNPSAYIKQEIMKAGCKLMSVPVYESYDAESEAWAQTLKGSEIIVLDGYHFGTTYQQHLQNSNCMLICIDDIHACTFLADVVINHAGGASIQKYKSAPYTQFFLGFKYCLLREVFLIGRKKEAKENELLICLGGADPRNDTLKVWERAVGAGFAVINILIGAAYQYKNELEAVVGKSTVSTKIHYSLDEEAVAALMQQCAHAVLSPSTIVLEYMSFGGCVYLYQIADNQKHIKKHLLESGLATDFKDLGTLTVAQKASMMAKQQAVFDGKSGDRLLQMFRAAAVVSAATLCRAMPTDMEVTFCWANDPVARQMSYNIKPILLQEHAEWYSSKLVDPYCHFYIFKAGDAPFAQIRFDQKPDYFLISYFIDASYRGKGLGSFILAEGIKKLKQDTDGRHGTVVGYVKKDNYASCSSFEKMNFKKEETADYFNTFKYTLHY